MTNPGRARPRTPPVAPAGRVRSNVVGYLPACASAAEAWWTDSVTVDGQANDPGMLNPEEAAQGVVPAIEGSWACTPGRRRIMQGNRRRDTSPELAVRRLLHARGLRFRVDYGLPFDRRRKADVAFTRQRVAVFVDGCFWHGCPEHYRAPATNAGYWSAKVAGNEARDRDTEARLQALGWLVLRFWEHEPAEQVAAAVAAAVEERRTRRPQPSVGSIDETSIHQFVEGPSADEAASDPE